MDDLPDASKLTRSKQRWAEDAKFLTGQVSRPEDERLPPGQHLVKNWPVLDLGRQPDVSRERWRLKIGGLVQRPVTLDWAGFMALPQRTTRSDIHCVTTWSRYDNDWTGVKVRDLFDMIGVKEEAGFVMLHSSDGYTTNLPLMDFAAPDAILATHWMGQPLTRAHGGPMRAVIPHLYFWKSAKWLNRIDLLPGDQAGFWERNGYHMYGDPWREQRYG